MIVRDRVEHVLHVKHPQITTCDVVHGGMRWRMTTCDVAHAVLHRVAELVHAKAT